jgi:hypothetical protein
MMHSKQLAALAQAGPAGLGLATDQRFELTPHIELINRELIETIAAAEGRQSSNPEILLVSVPPRHGKSMLISTLAPAWYLGAFPERQVMLASYEADFASGWGSRVRDLLTEHGEKLFGVKVDRTNRAARRWGLQGSAGGMISAGVGGAITGRGAHLLIIDDPIKNAEQAMSEVIRENQWEWWLSTARSRLEPGGVVVVLMTRWHEGDLGGRMLAASEEPDGDPVREIRLPALAEDADPLGREKGEALWPERYRREALQRTRSVVGPYWWSAMYQGRPTPDEGGIFARQDFRYFEEREGMLSIQTSEGPRAIDPNRCRKATYVDLAVSTKETADYTVALKVLVAETGELLIDEVLRARIPGPLQASYLADNYSGILKIEAIGYQSALIQALIQKSIPVEPVYPDKDKVTRASAAGALYKSGRIYHRRGAPWLHDFQAELLAFPAGEHDDQVDALAYAARDLPSMQAPHFRRRQGRHRGRPLMAGLLDMQF